MTDPIVPPATAEYNNTDWQTELGHLSYAYGKPVVVGQLKENPEDFLVTELMEVNPTGEGEHYWLDISKTKCNTDQVAKGLARFANVAYRDVGYSGLKDFFAETRQWFSVWMPKAKEPDWQEFDMPRVQIHQVRKHSRKIKRGTHRANYFDIVIRDLQGDKNSLELRLEKIHNHGVPNYFGPQRFGREADNMNQAYAMLVKGKKIKNRNLRSILLSSARAWLFNTVVSQRVLEQSWQQLQSFEPANLNGSNSVFIAEGTDTEMHRVVAGDIHPTGPMWGQGYDRMIEKSPELHEWECGVLKKYLELRAGLEKARLDYQRRPLRAMPGSLEWEIDKSELHLSFELPCGQFATSVLRELVMVS